MAAPTTCEKIADGCCLLRDALDPREQDELSSHIASRDRTPSEGDRPACMMPSPRTLVLGDDGATPTATYLPGDASIATTLVDKVVSSLKDAGLDDVMTTANVRDIATYSRITMGAIRYRVPDGRFPPHVDHCKNSAVVLMSLGRDAKFTVRGRDDASATRFAMRSGDALVFDASSEARVLHGVEGIHCSASDSGEELSRRHPVFRSHRYGVQCRLHF